MQTDRLLRLVGQLAVRQIQRRIRTGKVSPKTSKAGTTLYTRGALYRSIRASQRGESVIITAGGPGVPYARIHHEGGMIRPKNAKFLAIPIHPMAKLYKPRDYPEKTFIKNGIIWTSSDGKLIALYVLKKQVEIPSRPYMYLDEGDRNLIRESVVDYMKRNMEVR